jgi:hypothetical protein
MRKSLILALAVVCVASAASAQPYPANGYIGVFSDVAGTQCCSTIPLFAPTTLHVMAFLGGATAPGISGAEFRLEFSQSPTMAGSVSFSASPTASLTIGNPLDFTPNQDPPMGQAEGLNIAWNMCQGTGGGGVLVGDVNVIFFAAPLPPLEILTKRRNPPGNALFDCPLLTLCDPPAFTKVCLTIPSGAHGESVNFRSGINLPSCDSNCVPVAVSQNNWSAVKGLYR